MVELELQNGRCFKYGWTGIARRAGQVCAVPPTIGIVRQPKTVFEKIDLSDNIRPV